ncbi:hypothetical protein Hamer_G030985, partial [Homarus americanus]
MEVLRYLSTAADPNMKETFIYQLNQLHLNPFPYPFLESGVGSLFLGSTLLPEHYNSGFMARHFCIWDKELPV